MSVPEDLLDLYFSELGKVRLLTAEDEVRLAKTIEAGNEAQEQARRTGRSRQGSGPSSSARSARSGGLRPLRRRQPAAGGQRRRAVLQAVDPRPRRADPGGQPGPAACRREVRLASRLQVLHLRDLVDPPGHPARRRRQRADHPPACRPARRAGQGARRRAPASSPRPGASRRVDELAEATRLTPEKVQRALEGDHSMTSLDRPVGFDSDASDLGEFVAVASDAPAEEVVERVRRGRCSTSREDAHLDDRSWYVLTRRFGLDWGQQVMTLDALGRHELGLSRESGRDVRKIENQALASGPARAARGGSAATCGRGRRARSCATPPTGRCAAAASRPAPPGGCELPPCTPGVSRRPGATGRSSTGGCARCRAVGRGRAGQRGWPWATPTRSPRATTTCRLSSATCSPVSEPTMRAWPACWRASPVIAAGFSACSRPAPVEDS
jgi:RNA polymerase nonessential primary-like sigma factor